MKWLHKPIHISWLIGFLFFGVTLGVGLSLFLFIGAVPLWVIILNVLLLILLTLRFKKTWCIFIALIAGMTIGLYRGGVERVALADYKDFIGREVTISGRVDEDPSFGYAHDLRVKLVDSEIEGTYLPGTVWASVISGPKSEVKRSDTVEITGKLKPGFANFPASFSYAKLTNIIRADKEDLARDVRDSFGEKLNSVIEEPESDLGMGILAGQKRALPLDLSDAFKAAGLTHIIVASGYNLTILVRFARRLFAKISRFAATSGASILVLMFALVTGFSPSMTRASIVAILSLLAWYYGRKLHPVILLFIVSGISALVSPYFVWGDAGWYMSFTAFAGVIILSPLLQKYFWGEKKPGAIRQIIIDTICASLCTLPIISFFMGTIAPFGLLTNVLVLPIVPITMLLTFITGIFAVIIPIGIAGVIALPATWLLSYIIKIGEWVASLPYSLIQFQFTVWHLVICYLLLLSTIFYMYKKTKFNFRNNYLVE